MTTRRILLGILCLTFYSVNTAFSGNIDEPGSRITFVPHGLLFRPLVANTYEPRVGLLSQLGKNLLRLDIGNSIDLLQYRVGPQNAIFTMGSDFFTYTLLRGESDLHFPVDASDYFFGVNFNYRSSEPFGVITSRIRISHISSHFVDGHYDNTKGEWKELRYPVVYSREFVDVVTAIEPSSLNETFRGYIGATYLIHVDPASLARFTAYAGVELHSSISKNIGAYLAYQATAIKISSIDLRNSIQLGAKFGEWGGRGLNLFASYFAGYSIHGEYFDLREHYFALGFLVDF